MKKLVIFKKTVDDYINYIEKNNNIEKLFIVTFPHKNHLPELLDVTGEPYKHNVSNIIDNLATNRKKSISFKLYEIDS